MSPRRNRPRSTDDGSREPAAPAGSSLLQRTEPYRGEDWVVRTVAGAADRRYRCPGCDQEIPPRVGHVVAWPLHGAGVEDRRHWHRACWNARERRTTAVLRGRGAPRY
ncbi:ATP/GTP-binding protein [Streptacidiphilus sp. ASG 303]|uniref:ATP/GTP-binding protein n=1 Tax=Streptacidiphilus sp. ASG 303 TaxID=2896847 RepID=UPI001E59527F|nr:ATP/GTP-binding protein [Streptacidiphilus sp. ASG 303]MCD0482970.1 ATP/GTP-binding protein [Streptacidiphilus sp. ASG 303]